MLKVIGTGSSGNCYVLETSKERLLIEAGIPIREIKRGVHFTLSDIAGCIVTHEHQDHSKSINDILKCGIDVYASLGTFQGSLQIPKEYDYRTHTVKSRYKFKVGGFTIIPFDVQHDANEPLGFIIKHPELGTCLFATDTFYLKYRFKGLNHIFIECNYSEEVLPDLPPYRARVLKSHMSLETLIATLDTWDLSKVKDIVLIHRSQENGNSRLMFDTISKRYGIKTYVAERYMKI